MLKKTMFRGARPTNVEAGNQQGKCDNQQDQRQQQYSKAMMGRGQLIRESCAPMLERALD